MATRKRKTVSPSHVDKPVHICYERILPDDVDPERAVRRAMRQQMTAIRGGDLRAEDVAHVTRMALVDSKKWDKGTTLKCRFLDGTDTMKSKVEKVAHQWEKYANIKFKFVATGDAEIRISFSADPGSWSALGRDALNAAYFPSHQPTMNYGWLRDNTNDGEYSRVVLHEFGHALACIHEHNAPTFDRKWNVAAVMNYFQGAPNFWTPAQIKYNVLDKYSPTGISATRFDPDSIMLYAFDGALFSDNKGATNNNVALSSVDVQMIKSMYPR